MDFESVALIQRVAMRVVATFHRTSDHRVLVDVRRTSPGRAELRATWQPGKSPEYDLLLPLGSLVDEIVMELRLEKTRVGQPIFSTEEPTFDNAEPPVYYLNVIRISDEDE